MSIELLNYISYQGIIQEFNLGVGSHVRTYVLYYTLNNNLVRSENSKGSKNVETRSIL